MSLKLLPKTRDKLIKPMAGIALLFTSIAFTSGVAAADGAMPKYDFPPMVTPIGNTAVGQHHLTLWICLAIAVVVFGVMLYSIIMHRKSRGVKPAHFHESTVLEVLWTIVPFAILIYLAVAATKTLIDYEDTKGSQMTIKIIGKQWYWEYEYVDDEKAPINKPGSVRLESRILKSHLDTALHRVDPSRDKPAEPDPHKVPNYLLEVDNPLVVPTNTQIQFLIRSEDVIHSWSVNQFGLKKDAIPGYVNKVKANITKPGIYRGQCAEHCGRLHAFMPIVVDAKSPEDYQKWLASTKLKIAADKAKDLPDNASKEALMAKGAEIYSKTCAGCHGAEGSGVATFPALKGSKIANGVAKDHINIVKNGKGGMPPFGTMSPSDMAAVITYERNAWGNKGSVVTPADIKAAK